MDSTTQAPTSPARPSSPLASLAGSAATAVTVLWTTVVLCAVFGPDLISGSNHEHLPLVGMTMWLWATIATAYLMMGVRRSDTVVTLVVGTSAIWGLVLVTVLVAPSMVTGTDPTTIPFAALLAPVGGAVATGFLALAGCPARR